MLVTKKLAITRLHIGPRWAHLLLQWALYLGPNFLNSLDILELVRGLGYGTLWFQFYSVCGTLELPFVL